MIGIIGTAGRGADLGRLSERSFAKMGEIVYDIITNRLQTQCVEADLISGGAAWADHLAVHHFIRGPFSLTSNWIRAMSASQNTTVVVK